MAKFRIVGASTVHDVEGARLILGTQGGVAIADEDEHFVAVFNRNDWLAAYDMTKVTDRTGAQESEEE